MALKYSLVERRDMRKEATPRDTLLFGQTKVNSKVLYDELCEEIVNMSTASEGDVDCVMKGLVKVLRKNLIKGNSVQLGILGTFRLVAGSPGVEKEEDFNASLFRRPRIAFVPGTFLNDLQENVRFEKETVKTVMEKCDKEHAM